MSDKPSNVIPMFQAKKGKPAWLVCPCQPDGVPYMVMTIATDKNPVITGLVCPECDTTFSVVNGVVSCD